jgi:CBS domain-containing protein
MPITAFQWEDGPNHTQRVHPLGDRNDQNSKRNGCSGWLARWRAPDLSICTARGNRSTARCLHGGRPDVVQLGDSEQGTHSDLLGVEDGPAYAAVPGSVCQALTSQRFDLALPVGGRATAADVMTPGIHCCRDDDELAKAIRHMETLKVRRLPVINKSKRMVGILSLGDLSHSASGDLLSEWAKSISAHH